MRISPPWKNAYQYLVLFLGDNSKILNIQKDAYN